MRRYTLVLLSITALLMGATASLGCGDSGGGGSGGAGGATSSTTAGAGGAGGASCVGDDFAWSEATKMPIACTTNADCCVIINGCTSAAQVVAKMKVSAAKSAWPSCDNECVFCTPPAVAVECANSVCVGYQLPEDGTVPNELRKDHCGMDGAPLMMQNPGSSFVCGP